MSKEPERLDKYELLERLGQGGMGEVWKARDTQLRRYVAIKFLHANLQSNPDFVTHFMREARFVASLHHPNIVQIHDFQLTEARGSGTTAYMVMDYVEGGTLADYIRSTSRKGFFPTAADLVYLFTAISLALDYAHQKGMVHRDIKPANILLDRRTTTGRPMGEPILTDFGIARLQGAVTTTMTRAGIGTPLYISPEQAKGQAADERSDLYSLGIILYEILTGVTPYRGDSPIVIMMQQLQEMPAPPALINPGISPALSTVVLQSIAKDPEARFPTASAMTLAIAQSLGIPAPASLSRSKIMSEQTEYNPLQPDGPMPGIVSPPPALTSSPPALSTPASAGYPAAQLNSPAYLTPGPTDQRANDLRAGSPGLAGLNSPQVDHQLQPTPVSPPVLPAVRPRRKGLYIGLIALVLLLLVGISAFVVPSLLSPKNGTPTPNTSASVVGQVVFSSGPNAANNTYNQLQITLNNIPSPPAGETYYAWLENTNNEAQALPHWALQVSNGTVNGHFVDANYPDLLDGNTLFLITKEGANATPVIPSPTSTNHLYYASISQPSTYSPSVTFDVRQCPGSGTNNPGNPCR